MKKSGYLIGCLILAIGIFVNEISVAATVTSSFQILAIDIGTCIISTSPTAMAFGTYYGDAPDGTATSTFTLTCSVGTIYFLGLDNGPNFSGGFRRMKDAGTDYLNYQIYQDPGHSILWGDIGSGQEEGPITGIGSSQSYTAYGLAPTGQNSAVGNYSDTITLTVSY